MDEASQSRRRWLALTSLCLGISMIVIDGSVVAVAIPAIRSNLGFSGTSLVWLVNAYVLSYGGFQLLSGRLGDVYGNRKLFLMGTLGFTIASLACGLAHSQTWLIWSRAAQGLSGAVVDAVGLTLALNTFPEPKERAKAIGICAFACCASASAGVFVGGFLTASLTWHWIFLINVPLGITVYLSCRQLLTEETAVNSEKDDQPLAIPSAILVTASLVLAVYSLTNANDVGWMSTQTVATMAVATGLLLGFIYLEQHVRVPLMPPHLFRCRTLLIANIVSVLWSAATLPWGFTCALYLQRVLGYDAMHVAFAFLPANICTAIISLCFSGRIVARFGVKSSLTAGLLLGAAGVASFAEAPIDATMFTHILPRMVLVGIATGMIFSPLLLAATSGVDSSESGVATGLLGTSSMMGGALGLAIVSSAGEAWTLHLSASGTEPLNALNGGYQMAFAIGAALVVVAGAIGVTSLPVESARHTA